MQPYSGLWSTVWCRGCPMRQWYPDCTACEFKEAFDISDRLLGRAWRQYFKTSYLLTRMLPVYSHPSRWREEWPNAGAGTTIRVPFVYG